MKISPIKHAVIQFLIYLVSIHAVAINASALNVNMIEEPKGNTDIDSLEGKIVKEIVISGNRYTKERIIRRELVTKIGKPYHSENVRKDHQNLERLRVFSAITISPVEEDNEIVLHVDVKETFPYLPTINMQLNDENGLS